MTDAQKNQTEKRDPTTTVSNKIGGDNVAGDKVLGDKIGRDKHEYHLHLTQLGPAPKPKLPFEPETIPIPGGPFLMGSNHHQAHEAPQHQIELPAFHIGRFPITNLQYAQYLWQTSQVAPSALLWNGNTPADDRLNHPVTGVTWYEALQYCQWLSAESGRTYTLPSEAQWEKAARTSDGRLYPWGNDWQDGRCHPGPDTVPVDAFPAQNEYGCCDLAGNAREWTTTVWGHLPYIPDQRFRYPWHNDQREDKNTPPNLRRVYRGGWGDDPQEFRCSTRAAYPPDKPGPKGHRHSFRVLLQSP